MTKEDVRRWERRREHGPGPVCSWCIYKVYIKFVLGASHVYEAVTHRAVYFEFIIGLPILSLEFPRLDTISTANLILESRRGAIHHI